MNKLQKIPHIKNSTLISFIIIAAAFLVYYFTYIPYKSRLLDERARRSLVKTGENFIEKALFYENSTIKFDSLSPHDKINSIDFIRGSSTTIKVSPKKFIESIDFKNGVFTHFFILQKDKVIFQTFSNPSGTQFPDSLITKFNGLSGKINGVRVHDELYHIFPLTLTIPSIVTKDWILLGLISEEDYAKSTKQLALSITVPAVLLLLFFFISLPLLKLKIMGKMERLRLQDVGSAVGSVIIGIPILIFIGCLIIGYLYNRNYKVEAKLINLNNGIESKFTSEIDSMYKQLTVFDFNSDNIINIRKVHPKKCVIYPYFNHIFKMDTKGIATKQYTNFDKIKPNINLNHRNYFKEALNEELWSYKGNLFAFESIVSVLDESREAVISKPYYSTDGSKVEGVKAISSSMQSVINTVLPHDYGFCIINKEGKVLFHSNSKKNLQENLFEETDQTSLLMSAINAESSEFGSTIYRNDPIKLYIAPIDNTPLFLITFYNLSYLNSLSGQTLSMSFLLFLTIFIICSTIIFFEYLITQRHSKLKSKKFFFDWAKPKIKNNDLYQKITKLNIALSITLILTVAPFYLINNYDIIRVTITIILFTIFTYFYFKYKLINTKDSTDNQYPYPENHNSFLFSWLISTCILPAIIIFSYSYQNEKNIRQNHKLTDLKRKIEIQESATTPYFKKSEILNETSINRYKDYLNVFNFSTNPYSTNIYNNWILKHIRPNYDILSKENRYLVTLQDDSLITKLKSYNKDINENYMLTISLSIIILFILIGYIYFVKFILIKILNIDFKDFIITHTNLKKLILLEKETILSQNFRKRYIIVGPPASGKSKIIGDLLNSKNSYLINCITLEQKGNFENIFQKIKSNDFEYIYIKNFEYNFQNNIVELYKRQLLELLHSQSSRTKIIISSEIHPSQITEKLQEKSKNQNNDNSNKNEFVDYQNYIHLWRYLLNDFTIVYKPLEPTKLTGIHDATNKKELCFGEYLPSVSYILNKKLKIRNTYKEEDKILLIINQVSSYYKAIWNLLSRHEKFVLYDLAHDHFVHSVNHRPISKLLNMGILKYECGLRFFNKSFENFILMAISKEEISEMKIIAQKHGPWHGLRTPLLLVVTSIIALLFISNPSIFNDITLFVGALGTVAALFPKITSLTNTLSGASK